jgi:hypothetical protein
MARTGRYRVFPIAGSTLILIGSLGLTQLDPDLPRPAIAAALVLIGAGMGVMFQTYIIAAQSAVDARQVGVTTATLQFSRSMGGSIAVAVLGAVLTARLTGELRDRLGAAASAVDPERLLQGDTRVPAELLEGTRDALAASLGTVFLLVVPLAVAALALALALPERPLRDRRPADAPAPRAAGAAEEA